MSRKGTDTSTGLTGCGPIIVLAACIVIVVTGFVIALRGGK